MLILLSLILLGSLSSAHMDVNIALSQNDIVTEIINLTFTADESYDSVEFTTVVRPLAVQYEGNYSIREENGNYILSFEKRITPGINSLSFNLVYDSIIEGNTKNKVFRARFYPENAETMNISLALPVYYILSDKEPCVVPKPDSIITDGQRIRLIWDLKDQADIVVFYKSQSRFEWYFIPIIVIPLLIIIGVYVFFKKKTKKDISDILSSEETKVIEEIRKGITKQKEIAQKLDFSKSKMSKVIRKLEEKELVEKKPFFKTNILKLSKKIR